MWRSLDPLYREHKAAGDEVKVVPLPYFGRDSSGYMAFPKYEETAFPVPVIYHRDINLKMEYPDRIYIHNPYDGDNSITSVDPEYYSDKLKFCTKELVYVPYYTLADGDIESAIVAPGCQNADKVVCWSEQQAENFRQYLDPEKIIVKERPPVEKREIPEAWKRIINGRRVILFNNSLGSLMRNPSQEIKKIDTYFRQAARDHVCVLWRPHPLFFDAIRALFPRYERQYMNMFSRFQEIDGIYDASWDLDRAIQAADEYVGDPSSVVYAVREAGKPVRII